MYGCEWDAQTGEIIGFLQIGYDGEDFIVFDLKTESWIAPRPQAVITKHKWDYNRAYTQQVKNYLSQICPEWLKKYVFQGRSSLLRTGKCNTQKPTVSVFTLISLSLFSSYLYLSLCLCPSLTYLSPLLPFCPILLCFSFFLSLFILGRTYTFCINKTFKHIT